MNAFAMCTEQFAIPAGNPGLCRSKVEVSNLSTCPTVDTGGFLATIVTDGVVSIVGFPGYVSYGCLGCNGLIDNFESTKGEICCYTGYGQVKPSAAIDQILKQLESAGLKQKSMLADLLRRPELTIHHLPELIQDDLNTDIEKLSQSRFSEEVQLRVKYKGYIDRQTEQVNRFRKLESSHLPP